MIDMIRRRKAHFIFDHEKVFMKKLGINLLLKKKKGKKKMKEWTSKCQEVKRGRVNEHIKKTKSGHSKHTQ